LLTLLLQSLCPQVQAAAGQVVLVSNDRAETRLPRRPAKIWGPFPKTFQTFARFVARTKQETVFLGFDVSARGFGTFLRRHVIVPDPQLPG
jgi:hypothetical protein